MLVRDHIDEGDWMKCPYCGGEAIIGYFADNPCPWCGVKVRYDEWLKAADHATTWIEVPDEVFED